MIVQIARQALRLVNVTDIFHLTHQFHSIVQDMMNWYRMRGLSVTEADKIVKTHPITRFIALRIRNVACPGIQDANIYAQKQCVEHLAELNESETGIRPLAGV